MFKKYFEKFKNEIEYHDVYNSGTCFNFGVQRGIDDQLNNIKYVEEVIKKMSYSQQREHFFYILQYEDGNKIYWFEYINLSREHFKEHILDDVEFNFKEPLQYLHDYKYRKSLGAPFAEFDINYFRNFLKNNFFESSSSFDFYVNLHNSVPTHIIYNALGEIDQKLTTLAKNKREEIIQQIVEHVRYTPLSLKVMCWIILPISVCEPLMGKIIL